MTSATHQTVCPQSLSLLPGRLQWCIVYNVETDTNTQGSCVITYACMERANTDTVSTLPIALLFTQVYSPAPSFLVSHVCFWFYFPVCMCACISAYGMVSVCTCGCGGQRLTSGAALVIHPNLPTSWSSLTAPDWLASEPQASSCSLFSKLKLQVQQVLYQLSHLSSSWSCSLVREINYGKGRLGLASWSPHEQMNIA